MFLGLHGKEALFPARLRAQGKFLGQSFRSNVSSFAGALIKKAKSQSRPRFHLKARSQSTTEWEGRTAKYLARLREVRAP